MSNTWKWRDGELSMKEFYQLSYKERTAYIELLQQLEPKLLSTCDQYILNLYAPKRNVNNFFSIDE